MTTALLSALCILPFKQGGPPVQTPRLPTSFKFPTKVSVADKLIRAKLLLKGVQPLQGLTGFAELSVQKPLIPDKASLFVHNIWMADMVNNVYLGLGPDPGNGNFQSGMVVKVRFQAARPGRPHLLSFYLESNSAQQFRITSGASTTMVSAIKGPNVLFFAMTPPQGDDYTVVLEPRGEGYNFTRVEIDIVN